MDKLVRHILTSRVYEAALETPLDGAPQLSRSTGNRVLLKREDLQPVFSFKLRGAYNRIAHLSEEERRKGIITASAGNHAQGVAYSAMKLGIRAVIVMPRTAPEIKVNAVRNFGAQVVLHGDSYSEAAEHCQRLVAESAMTFVHPFDDELVIAGQGTIAVEILRQCRDKVDKIFVPIGGGGLVAGIAAYVKAISPETQVVGVEPLDSSAMAQSLEAGHRVALDSVGIFADGVAVKKVGSLTYSLCRRFVDEIVLVDTDEMCSAIKAIYQETRSIVEPAGALAVAGLVKYVNSRGTTGETLVAVNSGANMNFEGLSYVAERAQIGEKHEALFAVTIPERPGSLKRFCLEVVKERNVTELDYRLAGRDKAHILMGIAIRDGEERLAFSARMTRSGFANTDLTDNELAKTHVRHMVGGRSPEARREVLFRFWFPERTGALGAFLESMSESWNISLFHYRMQGGDYGSVLIGLEILAQEDAGFQRFLNKLGYHYHEETGNEAYRLFM
jgi:threonine dehydratase